MPAPWALPRAFDRVGTAFMKHLDDEVAMETHRRMAVNPFRFCRFDLSQSNSPCLFELYGRSDNRFDHRLGVGLDHGNLYGGWIRRRLRRRLQRQFWRRELGGCQFR